MNGSMAEPTPNSSLRLKGTRFEIITQMQKQATEPIYMKMDQNVCELVETNIFTVTSVTMACIIYVPSTQIEPDTTLYERSAFFVKI